MGSKSIVLILMIIAFVAFDAAADDKAAALKAFENGKKYYMIQEFDKAAESFRRANTLRPNWKLLYNIGQSEASAKRYGLALEAFEAYLAHGGDELAVARRDEVIAEVERLRKMVGSVEFSVPDGALVVVDDVERGKAPFSGPLLVVAGIEHQVKVVKDGEVLAEETVKVSGGMTRTIDVGMAKVVEKTITEPAVEDRQERAGQDPAGDVQSNASSVEKSETGKGLAITGWVLAGLGAATLIGSVATGVSALSLNNELEPLCKDNGCPPGKKADEKKLDGLAVSTDVLLGVGAAVAVTGVVLIILGNTKRKKERVGQAPDFVPGFAGILMTWRF